MSEWIEYENAREHGLDVSGTVAGLRLYKRGGGLWGVLDACEYQQLKSEESFSGRGIYKHWIVTHPVLGRGKLVSYDLADGVDGVLIAGTPCTWYEWPDLAITMYA